MLALVTGSLLTLLVAADPAAFSATRVEEPPGQEVGVDRSRQRARFGVELGLGAGVGSRGSAAGVVEVAGLVRSDRYVFGAGSSATLGAGAVGGRLHPSGAPGTLRLSPGDLYAALSGGLCGRPAGRPGELLVEVGLHLATLSPEDDVDHVGGGAVLPYVGVRALARVAGPLALGAAVRADLTRRDLDLTTRRHGLEQRWDAGSAGGVSAFAFAAIAVDLFGRAE
jgi:hypothetical protein